MSLEEIIRKIIQSEFVNYLPYIIQQAKKYEPVLAQHQAERDSDEEDEILNEPMEIDFVQKKYPATDVVTTKCKIKRLVIPGAVVDPGANFAIMTDDIANDLKGVATVPIESLGMTRDVPIYFAPGCTIYSDFAVIKNHLEKPMLILPNTLLDKYDYIGKVI